MTRTLARRQVRAIAFCALLMASCFGEAFADSTVSGLRPRPGFVVELVAKEPLVTDPVAFDWGSDGNLWVVEMQDYPLGVDNRGAPGGRVRVLSDSDGDGRYDHATLFLDGLQFPNGILTWGRGVLVTCAPEIFYAEDTDGDGQADRREVLFSGFGEVNPQHRINGLRWGLDNWVYCANGDFAPARRRPDAAASPENPYKGPSPGATRDVQGLALSGAAILCHKTGVRVDIRNRDFRFRPESGELDPQSGQSQYGRNRDAWGNWFACNHSTPIWHYALADHYLRRNPHLAPPSPRAPMARSVTFSRESPGRGSGSRRRPEGNPFTSACSVMVYRDDLFGDDFASSWFVCEPVHNLVHREVLSPQGVTFTTQRAGDEATTEFLVSSDPLFTPVMVRTGPDGALWVADMYRRVLEHPHWLPRGWEERIDVREGSGKGRIYRVFPVHRRPRAVPRLDVLNADGLARQLDSPNGWLRDKVQQLIVAGRIVAAVPALESLATDSRRSESRMQALCTLDGLGALQQNHIERALGDRHGGVRRHAVRLSERFLPDSPQLARQIIRLTRDESPGVRLQVAYTLGRVEGEQAAVALTGLLKSSDDEYLVAATLSSLRADSIATVTEELRASSTAGRSLSADRLSPLLSTALGFRSLSVAGRLIASAGVGASDAPLVERFTQLATVFAVLDEHRLQLGEVLEHAGTGAVDSVARLLRAARGAAQSESVTFVERMAALRLLGREPYAEREDVALLASSLAPHRSTEEQTLAVATLGSLKAPDVADALLAHWKQYSPSRRTEVLDVLLRRDSWTETIVAAIEEGGVQTHEIDAATRQRLLEHPRPSVAKRARSAFDSEGRGGESRGSVIESYRAALDLPGVSARGVEVFSKTCSACHRLGKLGTAVGPDLSVLRDKSPEYLLTAILDPNRAVEPRYLGYTVVLKDGTLLFGMIAEETSNSIVLVTSSGERRVILRSRLEALYGSERSVMPEGLDRGLDVQTVADLIAFVRSGDYPKDPPQVERGRAKEKR